MNVQSIRLLLTALVLFALASCTPPGPGAVGPPSVPRQAWLPEGPARAVILAVHGFNDYSNAFAEFGEFAAARGVAVHAYDQRGFGANPDAGWWPGTLALIADLRRQQRELSERYPGVPVYLLGESMGAAVIIAAAATGEPIDAQGTILSAPAVWGADQLSPFYRATLWLAVRLMPGVTFTGKGLHVRPSDNIEMLRELSADPLVIKHTRVDSIAGLVSLMDVAYTRADSLPGPLLVLGGARDEIVPPVAHAAMLERLTAAPCTEVVYPQGYHMLLRDVQRRVVWQDVLAWIEALSGNAEPGTHASLYTTVPLPSGLGDPCGGSLSPVAASLQ